MTIKIKHWGGYGLILALTLVLAATLTACSSTTSTSSPDIGNNVPPSTSAPQPTTNNNAQSGNGQAPFPDYPGSGPSQRPGLAGTIAKLENNVMTITTSRGETIINISSDTTIQKLVDATKADLQTGLFLTVMGTQNTDNSVVATSITVRQAGEISSSNPTMTMAPGPGGNPIPTGSITRPNNSGRGVMGTLSNIDGNTLTLTSGQETITVTINDGTKIQKIESITVSDLKTGDSVSASGDSDNNGNLNATSIMVGQMDQMPIPGPQGNLPPPAANGGS
jgi:hypothetical protein